MGISLSDFLLLCFFRAYRQEAEVEEAVAVVVVELVFVIVVLPHLRESSGQPKHRRCYLKISGYV